MTVYRIEPRDPLVTRDGRPNDGRSQSASLGFPPPSVIAGVVRTALGRRNGRFDRDLVQDLLSRVEVRGPLLGGPVGPYVPAPADALVVRREGERGLVVRALRPIPLPDGCASSLDAKSSALVGVPPGEVDPGKPLSDAPRYWRWASFEQWLRAPGTREDEGAVELLGGGVSELATEARMHVALGETFTAREGMLFGTVGLRASGRIWTARDRDDAPDVDLHLEVDVSIAEGAAFPGKLEGLRPMAGERRLARWAATHAHWPDLPEWLRAYVRDNDRPLVRLVLLTPAYVEASLRPVCLTDGRAELVAARVGRPLTISGWDFAYRDPETGRRGRPKRTRRLAPAGSVYWLRLAGDADARARWLEDHWLRNVGDDPQLRRDGFGLAAIGIGTEVVA